MINITLGGILEQKKNQNPDKKAEEKSERKHKLWKLLAALLIIVVVIIILWLLLRGKTTTSGKYPENVKSSALKCISDSASYSKIGSINDVQSTETEITSVFYDADEINSVSLKHTLFFSSNHSASQAEAVARANFTYALGASSYGVSKFDNKFTILDNKLVVTVHGKKHDWNSFNQEYFMIKSEEMPTTLAELKAAYETQGFSCEIIE